VLRPLEAEAERCEPDLRRPSLWSERLEVAEAAVRLRHQEGAAVDPVVGPCLWEAAGANPGRESECLVQAAKERLADACRSWVAMLLEELVSLLQTEVVGAEELRQRQAEAVVGLPPWEAEVAERLRRERRTSWAEAHMRPEVEGAAQLRKEAEAVVHRAHPSWAEHLAGQPWEVEAERLVHPSWAEQHLERPS
jgi:hypothetical protein